MDKLGVSSDVHNGWNGSTSILFLFLACTAVLSTIPFSLIKKYIPPVDQAVEVSTESKVNEDEEKRDSPTTKKDSEKKSSVLNEIKAVWKTGTTARMLLLLCFFFNDGYQQVFFQSMFTRQIANLATVGTVTGIYSICDVIFSYMHGWLSDRFGHTVVVTLAVLSEIAAIVISWFANKYQDWTIYCTGVVMAIADAGFQTEVGSMKVDECVVFGNCKSVLCIRSYKC